MARKKRATPKVEVVKTRDGYQVYREGINPAGLRISSPVGPVFASRREADAERRRELTRLERPASAPVTRRPSRSATPPPPPPRAKPTATSGFQSTGKVEVVKTSAGFQVYREEINAAGLKRSSPVGTPYETRREATTARNRELDRIDLATAEKKVVKTPTQKKEVRKQGTPETVPRAPTRGVNGTLQDRFRVSANPSGSFDVSQQVTQQGRKPRWIKLNSYPTQTEAKIVKGALDESVKTRGRRKTSLTAGNANSRIQDEIIGQHVNLQRFSGAEQKKVEKELRALGRDLSKQIVEVDPTAPKSARFQRQRTEALLAQGTRTISSRYREIGKMMRGDLRDLSSLTVKATNKAINTGIGADVATVALPPAAIRGIVNTSLVEGNTIGSWLRAQSRSTAQRFTGQIRQGMLAGETNAQLVRRVIGTRVPGTRTREGGIVNTSVREANALVRSATNSVANKTRETVYNEEPIVKGYKTVVTLDSDTSDICKGRSEFAWDKVTGEPANGITSIPYPGPPPWHWNCRTTLTPLTKSWAELGNNKKAQIADKAVNIGRTRASMDGQVPAGLRYEDWLSGQSRARQLKALGPRRLALWEAGKIKSFSQLTDQTGRSLSLKQLDASL